MKITTVLILVIHFQILLFLDLAKHDTYIDHIIYGMCTRKPECSRKVGRYRMRWLEDAENDLKQIKLNKCMKMANTREEQGRVMTDAKILRRLFGQRDSQEHPLH
jgi:hypothetical protein